jgi:hypothetical protein
VYAPPTPVEPFERRRALRKCTGRASHSAPDEGRRRQPRRFFSSMPGRCGRPSLACVGLGRRCRDAAARGLQFGYRCSRQDDGAGEATVDTLRTPIAAVAPAVNGREFIDQCKRRGGQRFAANVCGQTAPCQALSAGVWASIAAVALRRGSTVQYNGSGNFVVGLFVSGLMQQASGSIVVRGCDFRLRRRARGAAQATRPCARPQQTGAKLGSPPSAVWAPKRR